MIYRKKGIPEERELIICTVKKILYHSIFVSLDEYGQDKEGMIHISEVSPGRIRNIRDFVKEGKRIVCKVLSINLQKGHIDLSLRRVNNSQMVKKLTEFKQEEKSEKLLETMCKKLQMSLEEGYSSFGERCKAEFGTLHACFQSIAEHPEDIKKLNLSAKLEKNILQSIQEKIKPVEIEVDTVVGLKSYAPNGIEIIKKILIDTQKNRGVTISYLSAEQYRIKKQAKDYREAKAELQQCVDDILSAMKGAGGEGRELRKR